MSGPEEGVDYATLQARFALCGHQFNRIHGLAGEPLFVASRWGMVRYLSSLEEAARFLERIEGGHQAAQAPVARVPVGSGMKVWLKT